MSRQAVRIAGVDEVGRGPLAGPVLAAAVVLPERLPAGLVGRLGDSKALTATQREVAFAALHTAAKAGLVEIGVGAASVNEIERLNILWASMLAMRRAVLRLGAAPDLALVDGNTAPDLPCAVRCIVGGDASEPAIAAASIIAKVLRDRAMARLALRYPGYGWEDNAGYGTAAHRAAVLRLGPVAHHRMGFGLLKGMQRMG